MLLKTTIITTLLVSFLSGCTATQERSFKDKLTKAMLDSAVGSDVGDQYRIAVAQQKAKVLNQAYIAATPTTYPISHRPAEQVHGNGVSYVIDLKNIGHKPNISDPKQAGITRQANKYALAKKLCVPGDHAFLQLFDEPVPLFNAAKKEASILIMCMKGEPVDSKSWLLPIELLTTAYGSKIGMAYIGRKAD